MRPREPHWSTWYPGTRAQWDALSYDERERLSFAGTGCQIAWPTWDAPTECVHCDCQIARGQLPRIARVNSVLRSERASGWLRFIEDRGRVARVYVAVRAECRRTGIYDAWQVGWTVMVGEGVRS